MSKINVLVTGVGAVIGYGVIQSLRMSKYDVNIIGMDIYEDAVGQNWCDKFVQAEPAISEDYPVFITNIMDKYNIDLVYFGTEQEIHRLSDCRDDLGGFFSKMVINSKEIVDLSKDKYKTYQFLKNNGFNYIKTTLDGDFDKISKELGLPFLMKLRHSYASKGIAIIEDSHDLDYYKRKAGKEFMVQELVGDKEHEYTASVFGYGDGNCTLPIIFQRKLSGEGSTAKAASADIPEIHREIKKLSKILCPIGPTNFQFRLHEDKYLLLEINPRISSATSIRAQMGFNEAEMCIDYFIKKQIPSELNIKSGYATRYISEVVNIS